MERMRKGAHEVLVEDSQVTEFEAAGFKKSSGKGKREGSEVEKPVPVALDESGDDELVKVETLDE